MGATSNMKLPPPNRGGRKITPKTPALTDVDRVFVDVYLRTGNATMAYRAAGYNGNNPGPNGHKMLKKKAIAKFLADTNMKAVAKVAKKMEITVDKVLEDLEVARVGALGALQYAPAIKASELHGRHIGMFREDYADREQAPMIVIKVAGGAQIAVVGPDQDRAMRPMIPHNSPRDYDEVLVDDDFL